MAYSNYYYYYFLNFIYYYNPKLANYFFHPHYTHTHTHTNLGLEPATFNSLSQVPTDRPKKHAGTRFFHGLLTSSWRYYDSTTKDRHKEG